MALREQSDFSKGNIYGHIIALAVPMTIAQTVQLLYSIVDRIYIGHLSGTSSLALTGLGLTFPVVTIVLAFTNLFGMGGTPLFSISRGAGEDRRAEKIMGNTLTMLCLTAIALTVFGIFYMKPMLYLFGASDASYPFAADYLDIYLLGTVFVMVGTGMNGFINAQGFGRTGMITVVFGAVANIVLDPIFIFVLGMGVRGAAWASVISQLLSAFWVMRFLLGPKTLFNITLPSMKISLPLLREITGLGLAGFVMAGSTGTVMVACNATLRSFGGDIYVGIMTVLNSARDMAFLPIHGLTAAAQPVIGFNFGARRYDRIKKTIIFISVISVVYMLIAWGLLLAFPEQLFRIFSNEPRLIEKGVWALRIYYFGFFMMALQMAGQAVFVGLGFSKQAVFFSLLRKIIIVVPLTLILPWVGGLGAKGVFLAEPLSNFIGGLAAYSAMIYTVRKVFKKAQEASK